MNYHLTEHARDAMNKRKLNLEWIERALHTPDRIEPDPIQPTLERRFIRIPEFGNRVLRVVVAADANPVRIITAHFDRRSSSS